MMILATTTMGPTTINPAVITMGCGDASPLYPGQRYEDWDLPDPAGRPVGAVRPIRDDILDRVRALASELTDSA